MIFGIGIDLVEVKRIERFLDRFPERGPERVFTSREIGYCRKKSRPAVNFAARFAAKEAAFKALGSGWGQGVGWRDVEVVRPNQTGPPSLRFSGRFSELARIAGISSSRLTISHTREHAIAEVLLLQGPPARGDAPQALDDTECRIPAGFEPMGPAVGLEFNPAARPRAGRGVYVAPSAVVTGDVVLADRSSVWHQAVVRGDIHAIRIGARSNIQDGSVIHVTGGEWPVFIGEDVSIGHGATVHGSTIENGCLIGIHAVVLDGAVVGRDSLVAAGCVVPEGEHIPPGSLVTGIPGKIKRSLSSAQRKRVSEFARKYLKHTEKALKGIL